MTETIDAIPALKTKSQPMLRASAIRLLIVSLGLGLWANFLLIKHPIGVSFPLFAFSGLLALFALAALEHIRPAWRNVWLAAPALFFAAMVAVRANGFVTFLNLCAVLLLAGMVAHLFTSGDLVNFSALDYLVRGTVAGFEIGLLRPFQSIAFTGREARNAQDLPRRWVAVVRGLVLAVPILLVFTLLFTSADAAFNQYVLDALKAFSLDNPAELIGRLMFTCFVAWVCLGGLAYAFRTDTVFSPAASLPTANFKQLGFIEAAIILVSVNLLFAAFVAVQFRYFFGGQSNINVAGFTYSDYARRGFGELVVVAVFTLGLGLALQTVTRRQGATVWGFNGLTLTLTALTGIILASAFQRLQLYEEAYGFTELRTYPHVFMVWVGVLLAVFLLTVLIDRPRLFVFGVLLAGLGFVATLDVLDTDAFIAQQNIARYQQTGKLDVPYLASLSDDAVSYLVPLLDKTDLEEPETLGGALHARLDRLDAMQKTAGWQGWHWAHASAYQLLNAHRSEIEKYVIPVESIRD